jgi:hypothetical protein
MYTALFRDIQLKKILRLLKRFINISKQIYDAK